MEKIYCASLFYHVIFIAVDMPLNRIFKTISIDETNYLFSGFNAASTVISADFFKFLALQHGKIISLLIVMQNSMP